MTLLRRSAARHVSSESCACTHVLEIRMQAHKCVDLNSVKRQVFLVIFRLLIFISDSSGVASNEKNLFKALTSES